MAMDLFAEPIWDIVEEHLDEAEFLWGVWEYSLVAPTYTLEEVAERIEARLAAHLDGLVLSGDSVAPRLLIPALGAADPARVSAAAAALLLAPGQTGPDAVLSALRELPEQRAALVRALGCTAGPELRGRLRALLKELDEGLAAAAAEVLLFHHEPLGDAVSVLLASDDPIVRALGLRALPYEPEGSRHVRAIQAALGDDDRVVIDAALDAGIFLAPALAWSRATSRAHEPDGNHAMLLLALRNDPDVRPFLVAALQDPERRPSALVALGYIGAPELVDASFDWLDDPAAGPLVGEMLTAMTGVDLEDAGLALAVHSEDEAIEHLPEDDLPRPDPMAVLQWWSRRRPHFRAGERYLRGRPRSLAGLLDALAHGPMRRRPALHLDLRLHVPDNTRITLQPYASAARQFVELTALQQMLKVEVR